MLTRLRALFAGLFHRLRAEAEMADELAFHLRARIEDLVSRGVPIDEATRQARIEFGGVALHADRCREALGWRLLDEVRGDLRYTIRTLRRSPTFTMVAVLTLTLAIGTSTAVFSLLDALVLRELPVSQPERLVQIAIPAPNSMERGLSLEMFEQIRNSQTVFSDVFGWVGGGASDIEADGERTRGDVWMVTGNFYRALGIRPYAGRLLTEDDVHLDELSPARVAVIGFNFWQRRFGGNSSVVGRHVRIAGETFTIVGIAPPGFTGMKLLDEPDVTIPLSAIYLITHHTVDYMRTERPLFIQTTGRLKEGVSLEAARAQITTMWPHVKAATLPATYAGRRRAAFLAEPLVVRSAATGTDWFLRPRFTVALRVLLAIAVLVLLIAAVNLAGLLLSRVTARRQELAVRAALGSGRARLIRQVLTEGIVLSTAAAACAIPFAYWSAHALSAFMIENFGFLVPSALNVSPDARVFEFGAAMAVIASIAVSIVPAWHVTRERSIGVRPGTRASRASAGRPSRLLMVTQLALSLVLVANAGLLVRSLQMLRGQSLGFDLEGLTVGNLSPNGEHYVNIDAAAYAPRLIEQVKSLPGVKNAALFYTSPGFDNERPVAPSSASAAAAGEIQANFNSVSPTFFATIGIPLLSGRRFSWQDNSTAPHVAIVSKTLSRQLFPAGGAVGRTVRIGTNRNDARIEIIGTVADAGLYDPTSGNMAAIYVPQLQTGDLANWHDLIIRTRPGRAVDIRRLQQAVQSLGHAHVMATGSVEHLFGAALISQRVSALLGAFFGTLALLLAAIGLYGLIAYAITLRTREMGIRLALGARLPTIVALVLGDGLRLAMVGLAIGLAGVLATTRWLQSMLYGIGPNDPFTIAAALLLLLLVAIGACLVPALRAGHVDPAITLRAE